MLAKKSTLAVTAFLLAGGAGWWFVTSGPDEISEEKEDTGYTLEEREELMRTIGYVQQ
jgi:hypothetical protein